MPTNTNLTKELAVNLVKGQEVVCPNCSKVKLASRYTYKYKNVEYKCPLCKEVYHPCKLI